MKNFLLMLFVFLSTNLYASCTVNGGMFTIIPIDINDTSKGVIVLPPMGIEESDLDCDGIADANDPDKDGDGVNNIDDKFPLDPTENTDTDGDGIGNNADTDDDNDGFTDVEEKDAGTNPLDPDDFPNVPSALSLSIIHVNDAHSHLDSETMKLKFDGVSTYTQVGGYARMKTKIDALQASKPNSLTLNAGDIFQGTLYYSLFKGEADAAMINTIAWDGYALGNHEFDDGDAQLATFLSQLTTVDNILAANIEVPNNNPLAGLWKPYFVKEFDGEKVGVIGVDIVGKTKNSSNPSDEVVFFDEVETMQKYIDELKEQGVNKIIMLSHVGLNYDKEFVSQLSGVDIVIGGDSHSLMGDFSAVGLTSHETNYPLEMTDKDGTKVCIAHAWEYAHIVGSLDVEFDEDGVVTACSGTPTLMLGDGFKQKDTEGNKVEVDADTKASILAIINTHPNLEVVTEEASTLDTLQSFKDKVDEKKSTSIGIASERLGHNRIPGDNKDGGGALPLGSDIAPIVAKSFYDLSNRADACIQNAGGVRVAIEEGNITMGDAYTLLPFANTLFEIEMKGSEVKQVLEDAIDEAIYGGEDGVKSTGAFPYAYALKYDVDTNGTKDNRILNLEIKNRATGTWSLINQDEMYVIVTNSYIAAGKDGYTTFKTVQDERGKGVDTYLDYALSFVRYVENITDNNESAKKLPAEDHCIKSFNAKLKKIGSFETTSEGGSEIVAFDVASKRMFTTNGAENKIDIINIADVTNPVLVSQIDLSAYGTGVNSVAVKNGKVAVAVQDGNETVGSKQLKGKVVFFDTNGLYDKNVTVGYLPDMVTFNEDGTKIIVANEGEPNDDYSVDPVGSIGIITVSDGSYVDLNFTSAVLSDANDGTAVRLGATPSNDKAKDIEPEYITVSGDFAYVTLQENNAMAKLNLNTNILEYVKSFGAKSWEADSNNTIDIEEEGEIKMKSYAGLFGLYMPDSIASFKVSASTYLVTANEGDGREYGDFEDEKKIKKLTLDPSIASAYEDEDDLKVMIDLGDTDGDGDYDKLYTYGARSFSIWDDNGDIVFDSGDEIGKKVALYEPLLFNQSDGEIDKRSGNKGAEPEALTIGTIDGKTYAFIGLERQNAIMVYDITVPSEAKFVDYYSTGKDGDISPEGMKFIPASESPNGKDLLLVSYEVSGSTVIYEIR